MRFMVDECIGPNVANWLREEGYEVFSVYEQERGLDDDKILEKAYTEEWILITSDKDFGTKVYREGRPHKGIILLRLDDERFPNKIKVLRELLNRYKNKIKDRFIVVTDHGIRFSLIKE
ncbi:MAG TPA: hypothetical protein ENF54_01495 [Desulfobacteraceae bacterium]|nr:hypothetical protein [Desulfobacteraceae bacterium]